jgi:hypothetical protein
MMKGLLNVLHPTFDALSAHADLSELDAARTRVGRHVARCARCREVVDEIRGLGVATRESVTEGAPDGLWARIETAAAQAAKKETKLRATLPAEEVPWEVAPSLRAARHWPIPTKRSLARIGGGLAVAAMAILAVMLGSGRTPSLQASAPSRLTMTPFRPAPGGKVHVRFNPTPKLAGYDQLVLVGQYVPAANPAWSDVYFGGNYDSLTTLRRAGDGAMVGDFTVPLDFKAAFIVVIDPSGRKRDDDGLNYWILVGGDSRGRPSLNSLLAALPLEPRNVSSPSRNASVVDTLQRYFPDHPAGFATAKHYRGEGIFADMLKFFQGAERKYIEFNAKLDKQPSLDADRLAAMVDFANEIQEPGEAAKWTRRLVREHPRDPRSLPYYANMVHQIELREPPADSIRPYLSLLDTLYSLGGAGGVLPSSEAYAILTRYGDPAMQRRWALLSLQRASGPTPSLIIDRKWLKDRELRDLAASGLRAGLGVRCGLPRWMARGWASEQRRDRYCVGQRASALSTLSDIALLDGQTSHALSLADSAVTLLDSAGDCWTPWGRNSRGEALLARGDTLAAAHEFAFAGGRQGNWRSIDAHKALVKRLGTAVDSAKWAEFDAEAGAEWKRCLRASTVRDSLEKLSR